MIRLAHRGKTVRYAALSVALLVMAFCVGCATYRSAPATWKHRHAKLVVDLPGGWLVYSEGRPDYVLTRDGLRLERIVIRSARVGKKVPGTARVYDPNMLPIEIAKLSLELIEAEDDVKNLESRGVRFAQLAGHDGYRADAEFVDPQGLPKKLRTYGVRIGEYIFEVRFIAAAAVYFDRHVGEFESMVASARLVPR